MKAARFLMVGFGVCLVAASAWAQSGGGDFPECPPQFAGRGGEGPFSTEPFDCFCTAEARKARGGYAYGSGPYDGLSNICMAALHAGATGKDGGAVHVIPGPVQDSFVGTLANGVFSSDWDSPSQFGSFMVEAYSAE